MEIFEPPTAVGLLRDLESLPGLPGTVNRVREMVYEKDASVAEVSEVVSRDPAILAKMLRVANSAAYGLVHHVDNIQLATTILGLNETYSVVLSSAVLDVFSRSRVFDYVTFWLESMVCASVATALSKTFDTVNRTGVFSAGLLRDIGRMALAEVAPAHMERIDSRLVGADLLAAEEGVRVSINTEPTTQKR